MIRNLLATTAIATLLATGAYAQSSSTTTPSATGEQPLQPAQDGAADAGASGATQPADATAQDSSTQPADSTAQDSSTQPADSTAQDSSTEPADSTAQDSTTQPADSTAQDTTTTVQPAQDTAQDSTTTTGSDAQTAQSENPDVEGQLASNIIGAAVYNGTSDDAENIGEVNDIVLGMDGKAEFAVIGVGGFLGIGEKDVAVEYATLKWAERDGEMLLVLETTKEQLEQQQAFDRTAYDPEAMAANEQQAANQEAQPAGSTTMTTVPSAGTTQPDATATAPATTGEAMEQEEQAAATTTTTEPAADAEQETAAADSAETAEDKQATETAQAPAAGATTTTTTDTAQAPADGAQSTDQTQTAAIDRSTLQESDMSTIKAEDFIGTTVYGANEEQIGEIGDVVLTQDGQVDAVLVDVGGFLGMGEKEVAIGMDNLQFMEDGDGNRYLYTQFSQEQLEAQPAYDEASYAENRDTMRLTVEN